MLTLEYCQEIIDLLKFVSDQCTDDGRLREAIDVAERLRRVLMTTALSIESRPTRPRCTREEVCEFLGASSVNTARKVLAAHGIKPVVSSQGGRAKQGKAKRTEYDLSEIRLKIPSKRFRKPI